MFLPVGSLCIEDDRSRSHCLVFTKERLPPLAYLLDSACGVSITIYLRGCTAISLSQCLASAGPGLCGTLFRKVCLFRAHISAGICLHIEIGQMDPIFGLNEACRKDPNPNRVDLTVGAYRDSEGAPYVFKCVRKVGWLQSAGEKCTATEFK